MTRLRIATRVGWAAGVLFLLVMAWGADHPPPPGFIVVVGFSGLIVFATRLLVPPLLDLWDRRGAGTALSRVALTGFALGVLVWGTGSALSIGSESVGVGIAARLLGLLLGGCAAMIGTLAVAATSRLLDARERARGPKPP